MIRILFLVRSLDIGGAERQLISLIKGLNKNTFDVSLVTFYDGGLLRSEASTIPGVRLISLKKSGRWDLAGPAVRLLKIVHRLRPHIVHGYMPLANELSLVAGKLTGARVVWGLRASNVDLTHYNWLHSASFQLSAKLSGYTDLVIANSFAGQLHHRTNGYRGNIIVIPNGICTDQFRRDQEAGQRVRRELNISPETVLVGIVARLDPLKDHATFLRCAALLARRHGNVRFLCVGDGPAPYHAELQSLASSLGVDKHVIWTGRTDAPCDYYNALDLMILSSRTEGTPNVVGEAMACERPCVVTDVGDAKRMVEDIGEIAPPGNPEVLAEATNRLLALHPEQRGEIGRKGRARIVEEFSLARMVKRTENALLEHYAA